MTRTLCVRRTPRSTRRALPATFVVAMLTVLVGLCAFASGAEAQTPPPPSTATLSADRSSVNPGESFKLTATVDRDLSGTGYYLFIFDDATDDWVTYCTSGTSCEKTISVGWHESANTQPRRFHAEVLRGTHVAGESDQVEVSVVRARFAVSLDFANRSTGGDGKVRYTATASATPTLEGTGYFLTVRDVDGTYWAACVQASTCAGTVGAGTYQAFVEDGHGHQLGVSAPWTITETDPSQEHEANSVDIAKLAGLFASVDALCVTLAAMPGAPHTNESTVNDPGWKCLIEQAAGKNSAQIIAAVLVAGGGAYGVIGYLTFVATPQDPPWTEPGVPPYEPAYNPQPPETLPGVWDPPIAAASERIRALNPEAPGEWLRDIAKACVWLAAQAGRSFGDCGRPGLPIFVTGGNVMKATEHDQQAIGSRPSWMTLNYDGITKPRGWLDSDRRCQGLTGGATGMQCHEYPYNVTEQGGQSGNPSIAPIPTFQNGSQGGSFGAGIKATACAMRPAQSSSVRGDAFLVVPVPEEPMPTFWICNGKSASSQPAQPPVLP